MLENVNLKAVITQQILKELTIVEKKLKFYSVWKCIHYLP